MAEFIMTPQEWEGYKQERESKFGIKNERVCKGKDALEWLSEQMEWLKEQETPEEKAEYAKVFEMV